MPDVYGQTDALAQAVASRINSQNDAGAFCCPVSAERRFRLIDKLDDIPTAEQPASVDVFPDTEHSERQGLSTVFSSQYAIHIFIQQKTAGTADSETQCAVLTRLRSEIIEDIKKQFYNLTNAVHPVDKVFLWQARSADDNGRAKGLYNLHRLMNDHVYESDTILIFKASV